MHGGMHRGAGRSQRCAAAPRCRADRGTLTPALVKIASGVTTGELALWVDDAANAVGPAWQVHAPALHAGHVSVNSYAVRFKAPAAAHAQESCGYVGLSTDVVLETVRYGGIISMACHVSRHPCCAPANNPSCMRRPLPSKQCTSTCSSCGCMLPLQQLCPCMWRRARAVSCATLWTAWLA